MALKWGILGLGKIANSFAMDLVLVENCELVAVASRTISKAEKFGKRFEAKYCHGSYQELFENPEVDIIYIATPHNSHLEYALEAMNHGKHVLCEKPLAINQSQVRQLISASQANNVFLMEAFWTRFNPSFEAVLKHIKNDEIGEVNYINADFSFYKDALPESRLLNMELAGGALLDVGVYPIFLSYMIMGIPGQILAASNKHATGADLQTSAIFKYRNGMANIMSGLKSASDMVAKIYGTQGKIFIDRRWHQAQGFRIEKKGKQTKFDLPTKGMGYTYEIEECLKCIDAGKIESEKWLHQDSLNLISICDEIRQQVELKYPNE